MLKKEYKSKGFSLKVSLDDEKELPVRHLITLEEKISSLVDELLKIEELIVDIKREKASGKTDNQATP